eukprot:1160888-Pelagomonas_calceolata.AAC.6
MMGVRMGSAQITFGLMPMSWMSKRAVTCTTTQAPVIDFVCLSSSLTPVQTGSATCVQNVLLRYTFIFLDKDSLVLTRMLEIESFAQKQATMALHVLDLPSFAVRRLLETKCTKIGNNGMAYIMLTRLSDDLLHLLSTRPWTCQKQGGLDAQ